MRTRLCGALLLIVLVAVSREAAAQAGARVLASATGIVTAIWDANTDGVTTGYRLFYGLTPAFDDNDAVTVEAGAATSVALPIAAMQAGRLYYVRVRAYNAAGVLSAPSNEVAFLVPAAPGDPCAFPLGATSVSVFVTGKLNKTGSGGPGSRAFITFQAASPNSPIILLSVRANGVDVPDSVTEGSNLRAPGSLWFTIPPIAASYSVFARNAAGCARDQPTGFTTTVP
jgi:hypothetical protein